MRIKLVALLVSVFSLILITNNVVAQAPFKYLTYVFPSDSLKGFDEENAKLQVLGGGFVGSEYYVMMYSMKRNFINKKYGYTYGQTMGSNAKGTNPVINNAPCVNEGFESTPTTAGTSTAAATTVLSGWSLTEGQNSGINGSCTMAGCCPQPTSNNCYCRATPWTAPAPLGVIPNSPLGGSKVLQMNDNITNQGEVVRIQQTFPVTSSNCMFQFAYMAAMDGSGHACCDQPFMRVDLMDCMNNILACPNVSITPPGPSCATVTPTGWLTSGNISYTPNWLVKSIDLRPYIGSCVTIKITVGDCDGWAHYGYAFVDCACLPMTVNVNNVPFLAGNTTAYVAACGVSTATLVAPAGLGPYSWTGPAGSGITTNTNQTINTTTPGNYTLTMNPLGVCAPITMTVNLQFGVNPLAGFTTNNSCTTYTITNTGTGSPAVQTYSFTGPGAPSSFTTTSPTSVVNFAPSSTYTIYQTVTNASNCFTTFSMVVNTPPGPSPAFTASPSFTQCLSGNAFTFNATTAGGTHTWSFAPTTGAPAAGSTNPYGPVNFTAAGTYTVIHTVNSAGCVSSTQSLVVVNTAPTASIIAANAPPCAGASATLTGAGGPGTLSWAGPAGWTAVGTNANVANFQTANNGIYTLTVNNFGCVTTKTVSLNMGIVPTPTISNSGPICAGQPLVFTALVPPGSSYFYWYRPTPYYYGGYNVASPTIAVTSATTAGNYIFYIGYPGCPTQSYTTTVVVLSASSLTVSNTGPYCVGSTIQLNAASSATSTPTFTWTGPSSFSSNLQNPSIPSATTTMGGVYTVSATVGGPGGCKVTGTTNVVVNPLPVPVIGSNSPVCLGQTINLTCTGGGTYSWSGPGGFTSTLQNPSLINSTTAMAGVYTVTVTSTAGCKNTATVNVTVTTPTTTASNTGAYCDGATIQLNTASATSYAWTGPGGFTSTLQNPTIPLATTAMSGVYNVTTTTGGCQATASTSVLVNPLPTIVVNAPVNCENTTIGLTATGGTAYAWTGPGGFTSTSQNPNIPSATTAMSGNYQVTVTDINGCVNTAVANVVVNPLPTPSASGSTVCETFNASLMANGGATYSWTGPAGFTSNLQNPSIPNAGLTASGTYVVLVTSAAGCTNTAMTNILVNPAPPAPTMVTNGPICVNNVLSVTANGGVTYNWVGPNGFTATGPTATLVANNASYSGNYSVTITGVNGCVATNAIYAQVNPLPTAQITALNNTGCSPVCGTFNLSSNSSLVTTNWTLGDGSVATGNSTNGCYYTTGIYTITATFTDANGCTNSTQNTAEVYPKPVADFNYAPLKPVINVDPEVTFTDASHGATIATWNWYFMNTAQHTSTSQNPTFIYNDPGSYAVALVVKSDKGCVDTIIRELIVGEDFGIYVPNAFTPNGDGLNDIFQPKGFGVVKYELQIFDRWGERVFDTKTFETGWDGKFRSKGLDYEKVCEEGVYSWLINVTSVFGKAHELKGHVTLIK